MQHRWINIIFFNKITEIIHKKRLINICTRNIYRYRNYLVAFINPLPEFTAHKIPYVLIKTTDKTVLLKQRNEFYWRNKSPYRMNPSDKSFRTNHTVISKIVFRLKIYHKLLLSQCIFHRIRYSLLANKFISEFIIIYSNIL